MTKTVIFIKKIVKKWKLNIEVNISKGLLRKSLQECDRIEVRED